MGLNKGIDSQLQKYFTEDTMPFIKYQKLDKWLSQKTKRPFPYIVNRKFVQEKKIEFGNCCGQDKQSNSPKEDCSSNRFVLPDSFLIKSLNYTF